MASGLKTWRDEGLSEKEKYNLYLCSREWGLKRQAVRERCGGWCERCKAAPMSHVHHLTYARKYREEIGDLAGYCEPCHEFTHGLRDDDPMLAAGTSEPTTSEACDLMSMCVGRLNYLLSSSCDLKYNIFGFGGPCEKHPELGPTDFKVVIYIRDPETYACGNTDAGVGDSVREVETRIAEVVAEIEGQNGVNSRPLARQIATTALFGREIRNVYLAGRISGDTGKWRSEVIEDWGTLNRCCGGRIEDVEADPFEFFLPDGRTVWFNGPFWTDIYGGHGGGVGPHAASGWSGIEDVGGGSYDFAWASIDPARLTADIRSWIAASDLVFAWLDSREAYGTLVELGYAAGTGKIVVVAAPHLDRELWLAASFAHRFIRADSAGAAWAKLWRGPDPLDGLTQVVDFY